MSRQRGTNISCHMGGEEQDVVSDDKDNGRPMPPNLWMTPVLFSIVIGGPGL